MTQSVKYPIKLFTFVLRVGSIGGAERDRTADLVIANDALSQLSYGPKAFGYKRGDAALQRPFPAME
jgi:hypothetical protein